MISTWSKGSADANMPQAMLTETLDKVRRHPWWHARAKLALAVLSQHTIRPPAQIMDVGCGWGINIKALEEAGYAVSGLDISRQILECIDEPPRRLFEADLNQALPPDVGVNDAVLALDVIEHLDDDQNATRQFARLLRPGGIAVVSVPARPDLFSEFDQIQGHRRRYVPETLLAAFRDSTLEVKRIFWWGQWMVPLLTRRKKTPRSNGSVAAKTYSDYLSLPPWPTPWLMSLIYRLEQPWALRGKLRTGTSLFVVACRPG
jgi:2-polyprenyl-3-methyl-5-hydroxy-6-metoxy-1,4-benzoquinol methylase